MSGRISPGWSVDIAPYCYRKISLLPRKEREHILNSLINLGHVGISHKDLKNMKGRPEWRFRIGRWRVLLHVDHERKTMIAFDFGPRGDIYKG
jgi:mRNA-degrading endonuclease RelE of RelBE toxin-antitoxin system